MFSKFDEKEEYKNCSNAWLIGDAITNLNKVSEFRAIAGAASAIVVVLFSFIPAIRVKSYDEESWLLEQFFEMSISYILFSFVLPNYYDTAMEVRG